MKILFLSRATLYSNAGGDTIQIINTSEYLKKMGITADVRLTNEKINYPDYDLIHFFNITRPADILYHVKKSRKPYVVSTIFVDYKEYEKKISGGLRKIIFRFLSPDTIEYLKVLVRSLVNNEKIITPFYILQGHKRSVQKVISGSSLLLPNSENEYVRLVERYKVEKAYKIIPNGINTALFSSRPQISSKENDLVICVARIEPLKNQLNLIRALNNTGFRLLIIGLPARNHNSYYTKCKLAAGEKVTFIGYLSQEKLIAYYERAKVHVLPSWFETTGLSSLEAAAMGCNIVITDKGDTREYFENYAFYCEPDSPESIYEAIKKASAGTYNEEFRNKILTKYTWQEAANKTLVAYREITGTQ